MKTISTIALALVLCAGAHELCAQTYTPVNVSGFNHDVFAESGTSAAAVTSTVLDLSDNVLYTAAFAAANGIPGGVPDNGLITNGASTYQLAPYTASNGLFLSAGGAVPNTAASGVLTLATPATFSRLSLLVFSTEGNSTLAVTLHFTDGTTAAGGVLTIPDWFDGPNAVYAGFGRITRNTAPPYVVDGLTGNNPRFYRFDMALACASQAKPLAAVTISYMAGGGSAFPSRAVILALSGVAYTPPEITPAVTPAICGSANGSIALGVSGGTAPLTFSWNTVPAQTQPTAANLPVGSYTCTITDANGCTSVYQGNVPEVSGAVLTASASTDTVCAGTAATLTAAASGGVVVSYRWQPGNAAGPSVVVSPRTTTAYIVNAEDAFGCALADTVLLTVHPAPVAAFSADTTSGCTGLPVTFINQSQQADSWQWDFGDGGRSAAEAPLHNYAAPGTYTVTLIAGTQQQCFDTLEQVALINVQPLPLASFTTAPGINTPLEYSEALFSFSNQSQHAVACRWDFGDGNTSVQTDPLHRYAAPGQYRVTLYVMNDIGCTDSSSQGWLIVVPDKVLRIPNAFSPNGDGINDRWEIDGLRTVPGCRVEVFNRWGQPVYESQGYTRPWEGTWRGRPLPTGTYYYVISISPGKAQYTGWVALLR